jgi:hypothetical protein
MSSPKRKGSNSRAAKANAMLECGLDKETRPRIEWTSKVEVKKLLRVSLEQVNNWKIGKITTSPSRMPIVE